MQGKGSRQKTEPGELHRFRGWWKRTGRGEEASGREKNKDTPGTKKSRGSSWKEDKGIPNFKDQKAEGPGDGDKLKDSIKDAADFAKTVPGTWWGRTRLR